MPRYHFFCDTCEKEFDVVLPLGSSITPDCPTCAKSTHVHKVIKPPMISFKGSGFYKTDSSATPTTPKKADPPATPTPPPANAA